MASNSHAASDAIRVAVRVRPFSEKEISAGAKCIVEMLGETTVLTDPTAFLHVEEGQGSEEDMEVWKSTFTYDRCFWSFDNSMKNTRPLCTQQDVFNSYGPWIIDNALSGYNCSLFAYGQTGSGKTHTMMGQNQQSLSASSQAGFIPRLCSGIFERTKGQISGEFHVEASYFEIYNERVFDLLNSKATVRTGVAPSLKVREHPKTGAYVEDLLTLAVSSYKEVERLLVEGGTTRTVAATNMNKESSRSHAIFQLVLRHVSKSAETGRKIEKISRLYLVDLAGSERVSASGVTGARLKEAANINKSLSALSDVIKALTVRKAGSHFDKGDKFVPYRNSALTWLLKESLGGNAKTVMLATISPDAVNYSETLSTLKYAERAKKIVNKARVNKGSNAALVESLKTEIESLREQLNKYTASGAKTAEVQQLNKQLRSEEKLMRRLSVSWQEKREQSALHFSSIQLQNHQLQAEKTRMEREMQQLKSEKIKLQERELEEEQRRSERQQKHKMQIEQQLQKRKQEMSKQHDLQRQLQDARNHISELEGLLLASEASKRQLEETAANEQRRAEAQRIKYERQLSKERQSSNRQLSRLQALYETLCKSNVGEVDYETHDVCTVDISENKDNIEEKADAPTLGANKNAVGKDVIESIEVVCASQIKACSRLKESLVKSTKQFQSTQSLVKGMQIDLEGCQERLNTYRHLERALESENVNMKEFLTSTVSKNVKIKEMIAVPELKLQIRELQNQLKEESGLSSERDEHQKSENKALVKEIHELRAKLSKSEALSSTLPELQLEIKSRDKKLEELETSLHRQKTAEKCLADLETTFLMEKKAHTAEQEELLSQIQSLEANINELVDTKDNLDKDKRQYRQRLDILEQEILELEKLKQENSERVERISSLEQEVQNLLTTQVKLQKSKKNCLEKIDTCEGQLEELSENERSLKATINTLQQEISQLQSLQGENQALSDENQALKVELQALSRTLEDTRAQLGIVQKEKTGCIATISKFELEKDELVGLHAMMQAQLVEKDCMVQQSQMELKEMENLVNANAEFDARLRAIEDEKVVLIRENDARDKEIATLEATIQALKDEKAGFLVQKEGLDRTISEMVETKNAIAGTIQENEATIRQLREEKRQILEEVETLKYTLVSQQGIYQNQAKSFEDTVKLSEGQHKKESERIKSLLEQTVQEKEEAFVSLKAKIVECEEWRYKELEALKTRSRLEMELMQAQDKCKTLNEQAESLESTIVNLKREHNEDIKSLQQEIEEAKQRAKRQVDNLQNMLETARNEIATMSQQVESERVAFDQIFKAQQEVLEYSTFSSSKPRRHSSESSTPQRPKTAEGKPRSSSSFWF